MPTTATPIVIIKADFWIPCPEMPEGGYMNREALRMARQTGLLRGKRRSVTLEATTTLLCPAKTRWHVAAVTAAHITLSDGDPHLTQQFVLPREHITIR